VCLDAQTQRYRLPLPFGLPRGALKLAWHTDHHACDIGGRRKRPMISAFIAVLLHRNQKVMIPMEQTIMSGCALCALLSKLVLYLPSYKDAQRVRSLEVVTDCNGRRETTWISPEHGAEANEMLLEVLCNIAPGDFVSIRMHA
jgi:hypothetical protein